MNGTAVLLTEPERLDLADVAIEEPTASDVVVDIAFSGISTGTEKLLWSGNMPDFPGMGYPLIPGYESIGEVVEAGADADLKVGDTVFVPGARCFGPIRGLFGGAASRLVVPSERVTMLDGGLREDGVLLALAATAYHAMAGSIGVKPDLIVGHGILGRLIARLTVMMGGDAPTVWETNPARRNGSTGYDVIDPATDERRDYRAIYDCSGDSALLDTLIGRLGKGGEIVLAGFYPDPLSFAFPAAFMREARIRVAAEWRDSDLAAVRGLIENGRFSLVDLITHQRAADRADSAYRTAFEDPACLKMVLDWSAYK